MRIEILAPFILFIIGIIYSSQIESFSEVTNLSVPTLRQLFFLSIILISGDGIVYKSFNVWVVNDGYGDSDNILNASISFKVYKSWIQENDIDPSSLLLYKYDGEKKEWERLSVNIASKDNQFIQLTANVPGLFFIRDNRRERKTENTARRTCCTVKSSNLKDSTSVIADKAAGENKKSPGFELVFGLVSLLCMFLKSRRK